MKRFLALLLLAPVFLFSVTIHVPEDVMTVQEAIDQSNHGDVILLSPGVYEGSIDFNGKNITVTSLFHTTRDTSYIRSTVLDGEGVVDHVVVFHSEESMFARLEGLTVTGGHADGPDHENSDDRGGAVLVSWGGPTLSWCRFVGNIADDCGGAISWLGSSLMSDVHIDNCVFIDNHCQGGGGGLHVVCGEAEVKIQDCTFVGNTAESGGGLLLMGQNYSIERIVCKDNEASISGGGLDCIMFTGAISESVFAGNKAPRGGAIHFNGRDLDHPHYLNKADFVACSIFGNSAEDAGGALYITSGERVRLSKCDVSGNDGEEIVLSDEGAPVQLTLASCNIEGGDEAIVSPEPSQVIWE